jgi:arginyl-tRNA synthetase
MEPARRQLTRLFSDIFTSKGFEAKFGLVTVSDRPDLAQFQCNGALAGAKSVKRNPREVATEIIAAVEAVANLHFPLENTASKPLTLSIAGPGFINIVLHDELLVQFVCIQAADKVRHGCEPTTSPRTVVIDYGGPNVAKGMHVGHLRSSIIGDSLARIHRFNGDKVISDNHIGDWGTQMGMLICQLRERQPQLPYFNIQFLGAYPSESPVTLADLEEIYPAASKRYETDESFRANVLRATDELQSGRRGFKALWQHFVNVTVSDLTHDYEKLGIKFDYWLGESFYEERMPALVERLKSSGRTEISDGALIIPLADEQEPEMPPLILVKTGGGFLYHTSDLATCEYRVEHFKADLALNVVDARQTMHFKQVFKAVRLTGLGARCEFVHLPFGTMNGTDGKPFKTRAGGVLKLKDLIRMVNDEAKKRLGELTVDRPYSSDELEEIAAKVGIATLKYADLKHNRSADYVFDLEKFAKFEGHTGPYLLYATVRIKSILRKALSQGLAAGRIIVPTRDSERHLMLEMQRLSDIVATAYNEREPHHLCEYGFNVSQAFNTFYSDCHILREADPDRQASWLALATLAHDHLEFTLSLLGISVPERM